MITFILLCLFLYIYFIPSGEVCPKCGSYATKDYGGDGAYFKISGTLCFNCKHRFNTSMDKKKEKKR